VLKLHATLLFTACFSAGAEDYEINAENDEIQLKMVTEEQAAKITKNFEVKKKNKLGHKIQKECFVECAEGGIVVSLTNLVLSNVLVKTKLIV
jgi:hypothetical protein